MKILRINSFNIIPVVCTGDRTPAGVLTDSVPASMGPTLDRESTVINTIYP